MVDTGASVSLISKYWARMHGFAVTPLGEGTSVDIKGAAGVDVGIVGVTSFTIQLTPTLEMDLENVLVSNG